MDNINWNFIGEFGLLLITGFGIFLASSAKFFTIREQEEFINRINRELDQIHLRIYTLEQTRPTTGELEAKTVGESRRKQGE